MISFSLPNLLRGTCCLVLLSNTLSGSVNMVSLPQEKWTLSPALAGIAKPFFPLKNPEANALKTVRFFGPTPTLSQEEKDYLAERDDLCSTKQSELLGIPVTPKTVLRIAIVSSGGGNAAALYLLHILKALEENGLFPEAVHYLAGISGSTFTIGALYASGKPFDLYYDEMRQRAQTGFLTDPIDKTLKNILPLLKIMADCVIQRLLAQLPPTGVDPYGSMLLMHYLGPDTKNDYFKKTLSSQRDSIDNYNFPLPLYIAAIPLNKGREVDRIEMSPLRVTNFGAQADIPASSFNWPIGTIMGICGSALSAPARLSVPLIINKLKPQALFKPIKTIFADTNLGGISLFPTYSHNFAKNIPASPYYKKNLILTIDSGIDIPFTPLLLQAERDIDLFIVVDAGGNVWDSAALMDIERYCKKRSLPFPPVYQCNGTAATIFDAGDLSPAPVLVYFPISAGDYGLTEKLKITEPVLFKHSPESLTLYRERSAGQVAQIMPQLHETMKSLVKRKESRNGAFKRALTPLYQTAEPVSVF